MKKRQLEVWLIRLPVYLSVAITCSMVFLIVGNILIKGIPNITQDLFAWEYNSENASVMPAIVNTVTMVLLALGISLPVGVCSAIYLTEYAKRGNKAVDIIRTTADTLAGIPSIVYGLFGYMFFVVYLGWGYSLIAGALTLAIMVLPVIMSTTEEALRSVPDAYREASFGLGAGKLRTIFKIVLPSAMPGILSGVILSIGRIVGETAALIYTAGTVAQIPENVMGSGRTLAIHMYALWNEGLASEKAYATAVILLVLVIVINAVSGLIASKFGRGETNA